MDLVPVETEQGTPHARWAAAAWDDNPFIINAMFSASFLLYFHQRIGNHGHKRPLPQGSRPSTISLLHHEMLHAQFTLVGVIEWRSDARFRVYLGGSTHQILVRQSGLAS